MYHCNNEKNECIFNDLQETFFCPLLCKSDGILMEATLYVQLKIFSTDKINIKLTKMFKFYGNLHAIFYYSKLFLNLNQFFKYFHRLLLNLIHRLNFNKA
mgnify:FL=1